MIRAKEPKRGAAALSPKPRRRKSKGYDVLVRDLVETMRGRLDRTRAKRGLRSVNDTILELLDEGAEK